MSEYLISRKRGFEFSDLEHNALGILIIKESIDTVSSTVTKLLEGKLITDILYREYNIDYLSGLIVFQYQEHDWTIIISFDLCADKTVSEISQLLQTSCIYLIHEDTSSCSEYRLYDKGICIEEFCWGIIYTDEVWEVSSKDFHAFALERKAQGNPLPNGWNPKAWDIYCFDKYDRSYQFRSNIHTATEKEVKQVDEFLNRLFSNLGVWLPDWEYLPPIMGQSLKESKIKPEDFVRVDLISNAKCVNEVANNLENGEFKF